MKGRKIFCSECVKRGYPPTLLGIAEDVAGTIRLWCKRCKKEIRVTIAKGEVTTIAVEDETEQ